MQRAVKAWLFEDNGGLKTLPQANSFEDFKCKILHTKVNLWLIPLFASQK
jgi:hypothetical protein